MAKAVSVKVDGALYRRLQARRSEDGVPIATQLRRAVDAWLSRAPVGVVRDPAQTNASA